MVEQGSQSPKN